MDPFAARQAGAGLLGEIEEESLEELMSNLRQHLNHQPTRNPIPIPALSTLVARYQKGTQSAPPPLLSLTGRYLPFVYHLLSVLIGPPHRYTVLVVDVESRFDITRVVPSPVLSSPSTSVTETSAPFLAEYPASVSDLQHIYVLKPARSQAAVKAAIASGREWMAYGPHQSRDRPLWGTIVVGGSGGDVNCGWKGWLGVERKETSGFGLGVSAEEALAERDRRQELVDGAGWRAEGRWGRYEWTDGRDQSRPDDL